MSPPPTSRLARRVPSRILSRLSFLASLLSPASLPAQADSGLPNLVRQLASMTAVTGYEQPMADTMLALLPGAVRDRAGNVVLTLGVATRQRAAVCPLDEPGYVVGGIRENGYLTLRQIGTRLPRLFDQQLEGQRITVFGKRGALPGVVGVHSVHLTRGRGVPAASSFTLDSAYVDVGAASRAEVSRLGIGLLAPVSLAKRPHRYGGQLIASPVAGRRAACAALLSAARAAIAEKGRIPRGEAVVVAFLVEQNLASRGLQTLANTRGPFSETLLVDGEAAALGSVKRTTETDTSSTFSRLGKRTRWSLPIRYGGTAVESVSLTDAESLRVALAAWIEGTR
jgi:putative aminopeptidase FrvX